MTLRNELPPLTALRAFQAAGRYGSFQEAARELGVTPSAVSHQIRGLEEWLGASLFARGARHVELTKAGKGLLRETERAFGRIATAAGRLRGRSGAKTLRVSALPLFTSAWLIPRLERFRARHPDIVLDIETTNRVSDLERDNVDVAIRNLRSPTPGLIVRKLLDVRGVPVCAPKLLKGATSLKIPADLARHTLIHVTARPDAWARWLTAVGCDGLKGKRDLSFDTIPAALDAAARGHGIAMGMHPMVWESPVSEALVVPFAPHVAGDASYYVAHRKADRERGDVKAFVDWLIKEMATFRAKHRAIPGRAPRAS
jgi:LysR family glycine cleavage system transcriptional activator